jgi:ribosomal protein S27E
MAIIVHRCFECGHPDVFQHAGITCACPACVAYYEAKAATA